MVHVSKKSLSFTLSLTLMASALAGCSSGPRHTQISHEELVMQERYAREIVSTEDRAGYVRAQDKATAREHAVLGDRQMIDAYERGVRDTLEDFRGRMHARSGFVWEPPMIEMVDMPAANINGAIYPAHRAPVIIRPGRWVEEHGIALPVEGAQ